jgi:hypothetical protein
MERSVYVQEEHPQRTRHYPAQSWLPALNWYCSSPRSQGHHPLHITCTCGNTLPTPNTQNRSTIRALCKDDACRIACCAPIGLPTQQRVHGGTLRICLSTRPTCMKAAEVGSEGATVYHAQSTTLQLFTQLLGWSSCSTSRCDKANDFSHACGSKRHNILGPQWTF